MKARQKKGAEVLVYGTLLLINTQVYLEVNFHEFLRHQVNFEEYFFFFTHKKVYDDCISI